MMEKNWDSIKSNITAKTVRDEAENEIKCARLLVAVGSEGSALAELLQSRTCGSEGSSLLPEFKYYSPTRAQKPTCKRTS